MNKAQQIIAGLITPVLFLILGYGYITNYTQTWIMGKGYVSFNWNDFQNTWWIWLITFTLIGVIEFLIFSKNIKK